MIRKIKWHLVAERRINSCVLKKATDRFAEYCIKRLVFQQVEVVVCPAVLRVDVALAYSSAGAADAGAAAGHRVAGFPPCPPVVLGGFVWPLHPSLLSASECASYACGSFSKSSLADGRSDEREGSPMSFSIRSPCTTMVLTTLLTFRP